MNLRYFTLFILSNLFFLANGKSQAIYMTFHNGSLKSIPLNDLEENFYCDFERFQQNFERKEKKIKPLYCGQNVEMYMKKISMIY
jgi:hypothetical protein